MTPPSQETYVTRACQPPHDQYPFCDTSLSIDARVADLISRLNDSDIPALLTARHNESGQAPVSGAIPALGIPAYDWMSRRLRRGGTLGGSAGRARAVQPAVAHPLCAALVSLPLNHSLASGCCTA